MNCPAGRGGAIRNGTSVAVGATVAVAMDETDEAADEPDVAPEVVADPPPGPAGPVGPVGAEAGAGAAVPIEAATGVASGGASSGRPAPGVPAGVKAPR